MTLFRKWLFRKRSGCRPAADATIPGQTAEMIEALKDACL
jgi:hypothetical protein